MLPAKNSAQMSCVCCGATFERTEITPFAPIDINGTISPSSPEYISRQPSASCIVFDSSERFPVAALIATMLSTSLASATAVSGAIAQPVLLGTLYMMIGVSSTARAICL